MDSLILFLVYCFTFFGSISFSYFLLRTLHPDVRELSVYSKLKYSFYISIVAILIAMLTVYLFGEIFLFVTFPVMALLVYVFDFLVELPYKTRKRKIAVPRARIRKKRR